MLELTIRTPLGLLLSASVDRIQAEDRAGWFGIRPGRLDLVSVLLPGLLLYADRAGEGYVAIAGGLLDLRGGVCRVMTSHAVVSRQLEKLADEVDRLAAQRRGHAELVESVLGALAREAYLCAVREGST